MLKRVKYSTHPWGWEKGININCHLLVILSILYLSIIYQRFVVKVWLTFNVYQFILSMTDSLLKMLHPMGLQKDVNLLRNGICGEPSLLMYLRAATVKHDWPMGRERIVIQNLFRIYLTISLFKYKRKVIKWHRFNIFQHNFYIIAA